MTLLPESGKMLAIYDKWDPSQPDVTHIAIRTTVPPFVFRTYHNMYEIPHPSNDLAVIPKEFAHKIFHFEKGNINEICKHV